MSSGKESHDYVRYAYAITGALLLGGTALSIVQPARSARRPRRTNPARSLRAPAGAPMSFADLVARLQPAVVNISTKQQITVAGSRANPFEEFFRQLRRSVQAGGGGDSGNGRSRSDARGDVARLGLHHLARRLCRHQQPRHRRRREGRDGRHRSPSR